MSYNLTSNVSFTASSETKFDEMFKLEGLLGEGAFSVVKKGIPRDNNCLKSFAVKCIDREKLLDLDEAGIRNEVSILKSLKHKYIIQLYDVYDEVDAYYLVMERLYGGDLFDRVITKIRYNELEARIVCKNILEAVQFIHQHSIAHRDLKPENLLLVSRSDNTSIKITDFGFATEVKGPNSLRTMCGTRNYIAPEILNKIPYDERADLWSVGVILFILLAGCQPFADTGDDDLFHQICTGQYHFYDECWESISREAKDLICNLMEVDLSIRLNTMQALNHLWFCKKIYSFDCEICDFNTKSFGLKNVALKLPPLQYSTNGNYIPRFNRITNAAA